MFWEEGCQWEDRPGKRPQDENKGKCIICMSDTEKELQMKQKS